MRRIKYILRVTSFIFINLALKKSIITKLIIEELKF